MRVGKAEAVVASELAPLFREILGAGTVYDFAASHADARALHGRQPAYAIPARGFDGWMVVRHNRHGGLLAGLTGDCFLHPTRAPYEFATSRRLTAAGVPTPTMLAYVIYSTGPALARADVITQLVDPSRDLAAALSDNDAIKRAGDLDLVATLVATLSRAGARHHDLNAKNVLLANRAMVLDVDRVEFGLAPQDALAQNLTRLDRSLRKRRERFAEPVSNEEIATLARLAAERL